MNYCLFFFSVSYWLLNYLYRLTLPLILIPSQVKMWHPWRETFCGFSMSCSKEREGIHSEELASVPGILSAALPKLPYLTSLWTVRQSSVFYHSHFTFENNDAQRPATQQGPHGYYENWIWSSVLSELLTYVLKEVFVGLVYIFEVYLLFWKVT